MLACRIVIRVALHKSSVMVGDTPIHGKELAGLTLRAVA